VSGERQGDREALDKLTKDVIDTPRQGRPFTDGEARDMARKALTEADRRLRAQGKR
jgi:hypothetical protein